MLTRIGSAAALRQGQFCLKPFYGLPGNDLKEALLFSGMNFIINSRRVKRKFDKKGVFFLQYVWKALKTLLTFHGNRAKALW